MCHCFPMLWVHRLFSDLQTGFKRSLATGRAFSEWWGERFLLCPSHWSKPSLLFSLRQSSLLVQRWHLPIPLDSQFSHLWTQISRFQQYKHRQTQTHTYKEILEGWNHVGLQQLCSFYRDCSCSQILVQWPWRSISVFFPWKSTVIPSNSLKLWLTHTIMGLQTTSSITNFQSKNT